ncbi:MAG: GNAT family N-acetyltransferase [Promicromonosporaceae bacterium]|nr:GNAT family N-acetyltransferase [Promicromonosporaceae bacterium]
MTEFLTVRFEANLDVNSFTSGQPSLDDWLRYHALRAQNQGSARTRALVRRGDKQVLGYYSLAPTQVDRAQLPRGATGGLSTVPAYLLARLALDQSIQGQGLGADLLADAMEETLSAAAHAAGRLLVVDAIDDTARTFYEHHGFKRIGASWRLYLRLSSIAASIAATSRP